MLLPFSYSNRVLVDQGTGVSWWPVRHVEELELPTFGVANENETHLETLYSFC